MWMTLVAMTLANSMILVDQTAVPLATPDAVQDLGAGIDLGQACRADGARRTPRRSDRDAPDDAGP
jgi:hypothetical protein